MLTFLRIFLPLCFFAATLGCSKKSSVSEVSIDFSQMAVSKSTALANSELQLVIIQISGEGLASPRYKELNCESTSNCGQWTAKIPTGKKLVQVIAVYDEDEKKQVYFAGNRYQLEAGEQSLPVSLSLIAETSSNFSGQYVPSAGALAGEKLTGRVEVKLKPANQIAIPIVNFEIYSGFFSTFVLDNLNTDLFSLRYFFAGWTGEGLAAKSRILQDVDAGGLVKSASAFTNLTGNHMVSVKIPPHFRPENSTAGGVANLRTYGEGESRYLGFLGNDSASKEVCWADTTGLVFDGNNMLEELCTDAACTNFVSWPAGLSSANSSSGTEISFQAGTAPNLCTAPDTDYYSSVVGVSREYIADKDFVLGFFGPLHSTKHNGDWDFAHIDSGVYIFEPFADLPASVSIRAYSINQRRNPRDYEIEGQEGLDCSQIAQEFTALTIQDGPGTDQKNIDLSSLSDPSSFTLAICAIDPDGQFFNEVLFKNNFADEGSSSELSFSLLDVGTGNVITPNLNHHEFQPLDVTASTDVAYFQIENVSQSTLQLDSTNPFHINALLGNEFLIEYSGSGYNTVDGALNTICIPSMNLPPGSFCHVKVTFNPALATPSVIAPASLNNGFSVKYDVNLEPKGTGFSILGPVYSVYDVSAGSPPATAVELTADVANGDYDVRFIKLNNPSGTGIAIPDPGFVDSNEIKFDRDDCPTTLPAGNSCFIKWTYDSDHVALAATENTSSGTWLGASWSYRTHSGLHMLTWNQQPELNFADVANGSFPTSTVTFSNPSLHLPYNVLGRNSLSSPWFVDDTSTGYCDDTIGYSLTQGASCNIEFGVDNSSGLGAEFSDSLYFYYEMGGTYLQFYAKARANLEL